MLFCKSFLVLPGLLWKYYILNHKSHKSHTKIKEKARQNTKYINTKQTTNYQILKGNKRINS
jgi:hypothetical protein